MTDIRFYDGLNTPPYEVVVEEREKHKNDDSKVFDWVKAAKIIIEKKPSYAVAGLAEDWFYTSGRIYEDGDISFDGYQCSYLMSIWATPILLLIYEDARQEPIDCWVRSSERPEWNEYTYWPREAVDILVEDYKKEGKNVS